MSGPLAYYNLQKALDDGWGQFSTSHGIPLASLNQGMARILGIDPTGSPGAHRTYTSAHSRRWQTWQTLNPNHSSDPGHPGHQQAALWDRILDLAGLHPTGWVISSNGHAWWQPTEPDYLQLIAQGVYVLNLNYLTQWPGNTS